MFIKESYDYVCFRYGFHTGEHAGIELATLTSAKNQRQLNANT
jgi:hypothetical protein